MSVFLLQDQLAPLLKIRNTLIAVTFGKNSVWEYPPYLYVASNKDHPPKF